MKNSLIDTKLNKSNFEDFIKRLNEANRGLHVKDHYTANPIYTVQAKRFVTGLMTEYSDNICIYDSEDNHYYYGLESFLENIDEDYIEHYKLNDSSSWYVNEYGDGFLDLSDSDKLQVLDDLSHLTISGYEETWEYVNSHLTKEAAERFIERKKHVYRDGLRIYVDSQYLAWEFNELIQGLLDGKIKYVGGEE